MAAVVVLTGDDPLRAAELADALGLLLVPQPPASTAVLLLSWQQGRLQLEPNDGRCGPVVVDFAAGANRHRQQGGLDLVVRAVRGRSSEPLRVVDATAGLGRDAFALAGRGFAVTMIERSPIVAALLADGVGRAQASGEPGVASAACRLSLQVGDATLLLPAWRGTAPDVIYLDPMFPDERKSALPKKEMRLFQQLLLPAADEADLLRSAQMTARRRVVVKRPLKGPPLAGAAPSYSLTGKAVRFDVYAMPTR